MRAVYLMIAGILLAASPAMAGTVSVSNNQASWTPTQCVHPTAPASVLAADRHTGADDMNVKVSQYNAYVKLMHVYMECLSDEGQRDANAVGTAIIGSTQAAINAAQKNIDDAGKPFKN